MSLWQATLRRNTNPDPRLDPEAAKKRLGDLQLTVGSKAIFVGRSHFGCVATITPDASRGLSKQVRQSLTYSSTAQDTFVYAMTDKYRC